MVKISFKNVKVSDSGYGLYVEDNSLEEIITRALGAKGNDGKNFRVNACDITVIIEPKDTSCEIVTDNGTFSSIDELEEAGNGIACKEDTEADTAE